MRLHYNFLSCAYTHVTLLKPKEKFENYIYILYPHISMTYTLHTQKAGYKETFNSNDKVVSKYHLFPPPPGISPLSYQPQTASCRPFENNDLLNYHLETLIFPLPNQKPRSS